MNFSLNKDVKLAKRYNNNKRKYLLVNSSQGKHLPVSPSKAFSMFNELSCKIVDELPKVDIIISFAETATAIGSAIALNYPNSLYVQTTREPEKAGLSYVYFDEEHSHATSQKLCVESIKKVINQDSSILMVDDEITTGKTFINLRDKLIKMGLINEETTISIACLINRLNNERNELFNGLKIKRVSLYNIEYSDYDKEMNEIEVFAPTPVVNAKNYDGWNLYVSKLQSCNPREGCVASNYLNYCDRMADEVLEEIGARIDGNVLVLGTEEYMFPAMCIAKKLEDRHATVFHATTRSPIGVSNEQGYPIKTGYKIASAYEDGRETFIYNLKQYDNVIIVTDGEKCSQILSETGKVLRDNGCKNLFCIRG